MGLRESGSDDEGSSRKDVLLKLSGKKRKQKGRKDSLREE